MPYQKAGGVYYFDRRLPIVGRVIRSLQTKDSKTARRREALVLRLVDTERWDIVRPWVEDRFSIVELSHAWEQGPGAVRVLLADAHDMPVKALVEPFRIAKSPEIKTATRYERSLQVLLRWAPNIRISELADPRTLEQFKTYRLSQGIAPDTVTRDLAAVRSLLHWVGGRFLARSAFDGVRMPKPAPRRTRRLNPTEIRMLLSTAAALGSKHRYGDLFHVMLATGLRPSEILRIRKEDIDTQRGVLRVRDSKTRAGHRLVPVSPEVAALIGSGWVGMTQAYLAKIFKRVAQLANLEDVTLRDLRRTHAQFCRLAEKDVVLARDQLGHTSVRHTEAYIGSSTAEERRGMVEGALEQMGLRGGIDGGRADQGELARRGAAALRRGGDTRADGGADADAGRVPADLPGEHHG